MGLYLVILIVAALAIGVTIKEVIDIYRRAGTNTPADDRSNTALVIFATLILITVIGLIIVIISSIIK